MIPLNGTARMISPLITDILFYLSSTPEDTDNDDEESLVESSDEEEIKIHKKKIKEQNFNRFYDTACKPSEDEYKKSLDLVRKFMVKYLRKMVKQIMDSYVNWIDGEKIEVKINSFVPRPLKHRRELSDSTITSKTHTKDLDFSNDPIPISATQTLDSKTRAHRRPAHRKQFSPSSSPIRSHVSSSLRNNISPATRTPSVSPNTLRKPTRSPSVSPAVRTPNRSPSVSPSMRTPNVSPSFRKRENHELNSIAKPTYDHRLWSALLDMENMEYTPLTTVHHPSVIRTATAPHLRAPRMMSSGEVPELAKSVSPEIHTQGDLPIASERKGTIPRLRQRKTTSNSRSRSKSSNRSTNKPVPRRRQNRVITETVSEMKLVRRGEPKHERTPTDQM
jgi:hypothetical protein